LIEKAVQLYLANQLIHKKFFAFPFQEWTQFWTAFEGLSTSSVKQSLSFSRLSAHTLRAASSVTNFFPINDTHR
jgi:hypothetical protein